MLKYPLEYSISFTTTTTATATTTTTATTTSSSSSSSSISYDNNIYDSFVNTSDNNSNLSPYLFAIDFDQTLAKYDSKNELKTLDQLPSIYLRPFLFEFLDYIKSINSNNILILWTHGTEKYISEMLLLLNMSQYFNHVLSRNHCNDSKLQYGCIKSCHYIKKMFPEYVNYRSILIDDLADYNSGIIIDDNHSNRDGGGGYYKIIRVKKFDIQTIKQTKYGISDTTLLNLIKIFSKTLFFL